MPVLHTEREEKGISPRQWTLAWDEFGRRYPRLKRGPAVLAFLLFTFLGQSVLGLISVFYGLLPLVVWLLVFLSTTILAQMFVINFSGKAYDQRITALEERLQPHLKISYANGDDDHVVTGYGNEIRHRTIRVRIENISDGKTIEGIKVKAERFLNFGDIPLYDTPLRISHDLNNSKLNGFAISPGEKERVDIVSKAYGSPDIYLWPRPRKRIPSGNSYKAIFDQS
jgi:hypothetical protein